MQILQSPAGGEIAGIPTPDAGNLAISAQQGPIQPGRSGMPAATPGGMPNEETLDAWVTIAMFECGSTTVAGREARALLDELDGEALVQEVARRVWSLPGERQHRLEEARTYAAHAAAESRERELGVIALPDVRYPVWLKQIADPPPVLWVKGDADALNEPAVGVVGSRNASDLSLKVARSLARDLSEAGVVVVSGLARGVDGAAHQGALDGPSRTVAVLGSGLSYLYPAVHASLARAVVNRGCLVSELPPSLKSLPRHFPLRNRIISGLSRAVVVIEAAEGSGSLITARMAGQQGRTVLAMPGLAASGRHRGSHGLIKDGARLVETVEDILEEIRWTGGLAKRDEISSKSLSESDLEAAMNGQEPMGVDELAARMDRTAPEILAELAMLEVEGRVTRLPGGLFMRPIRTRRAGR